MNARVQSDHDEFASVPTTALPAPPPAWAIRAVLGLRGLLVRATNAILPPEVMVIERATGAGHTMAVGTFARLRIADLLDDGPLSGADIAARLGTDPDATFRLMHSMASIDFVTMDGERRFSHGRASRAMRSNEVMRARDFAEYFASESNLRAWLDFGETLRTGKCAFDRVHGMSVWDWFDAHPDERECFARAMTGLTLADAPFVAGTYPFGEVQTVCDVGGGRGALLSEILLRHPHLRGTLTDNPRVLDDARKLLDRRGVADRVTLSPGSFFESVPAGADLYTLKNIVHDWDDARSETILRNVRAAMKPGQKVLLLESILDRTKPDPLVTPADLQMMMICGEGRERDEADFHRLFRATGFAPGRTWAMPTVGLIEGVAR